MDKLDKNHHESRKSLEYVLKYQNIREGLILSKKWADQHQNRSQRLQVGDVVKIKSKRYFNQWTIVDSSNDWDLTYTVMLHQGELQGIHKAELEVLELTKARKMGAFDLMCRMQLLWRQLDRLPEKQTFRDFLKEISIKKLPILTDILESLLLRAIEQKTTQTLINKRKKNAR
ncbi:MAG: hypothetical protein QNJ54_30180 [Prochloraceae cyanobacterium]|nr:hypothetical protein [Prochloraceae cyanobacterium]